MLRYEPDAEDFLRKNGASEGIRTLDIHVGNVMLYQLSYARFQKWGDNTQSFPACKPEFIAI